MSKYKMICLDIDGTLVTSRHVITQKTKEAVQIAANEKNIPVILVSARPPQGIYNLQKGLGIKQPIICYSGALVLDGDDILLNKTIQTSDVLMVYNLVKELGVHVSMYRGDKWYAEEEDEWTRQEGLIISSHPDIVSFSELFDIWTKENTGPNKIMIMAEPDKIKLMDERMKEKESHCLNALLSKPTYLEILPYGASKPSAIEVLCRNLGIDKSEIIAIGDNYVDVSMIEYAGLGIAMGNAPDPVKQCADDVTLSNDEDGVAYALEKHVLA